MFRLASLVLAALPALGVGQEAQPPQPPRTVGQQEVNAAIDRGVRWLLSSQDEDGYWFEERPGRTALALYALLKSGVEPDHPAVGRALGFLAARLSDHLRRVPPKLHAAVFAIRRGPDGLARDCGLGAGDQRCDGAGTSGVLRGRA